MKACPSRIRVLGRNFGVGRLGVAVRFRVWGEGLQGIGFVVSGVGLGVWGVGAGPRSAAGFGGEGLVASQGGHQMKETR